MLGDTPVGKKAWESVPTPPYMRVSYIGITTVVKRYRPTRGGLIIPLDATEADHAGRTQAQCNTPEKRLHYMDKHILFPI